MTRNPFFPALFAFLFGSLFSFASAALEGNWERLDGSAKLRLSHDGSGRLHGTFSGRNGHAKPARPGSTKKSSRRSLLAWRRAQVSQPLFDSATRSRHLGSVRLASRDRLQLQSRSSGEFTEWRRLA